MIEPWHWPARLRAGSLRLLAPVWLRALGPGGRIHAGLRIARPFSDIVIGAGAVLKHQVTLQAGRKGRIRIGDGVLVNTGGHIIAAEAIEIGSGVRIGEYVSIRDQEHLAEPGKSVAETESSSAPVRIGDNVWIGRGTYVGPGVSIGPGAVIGANSVVKTNIPAGMMAAGAPARVRRSATQGHSDLRRPTTTTEPECNTSA